MFWRTIIIYNKTFYVKHILLYSNFSKSWFLLIDLIQVPMNWIIATSGNSPIIVIMVWAEKNSAEFFFTRPHCIFIYQQLSYIQEVLFQLYDFEPQQRFLKRYTKKFDHCYFVPYQVYNYADQGKSCCCSIIIISLYTNFELVHGLSSEGKIMYVAQGPPVFWLRLYLL